MKEAIDKQSSSPFRKVLIVVAIIAVMVWLLYPAVNVRRPHPHTTKERVGVCSLTVASKAYYNEFASWPTNTATTVLIHTNIFDNPRSIVFFEYSPKALLKSNSVVFYVDSWKRPYRIRFDTDYDGIVTNPANEAVEASVLVWSLGPDGIEATRDDVKSW